MKSKTKSFMYALLCAILSIITTQKLSLMYFTYIASTNNTTAPFAAFITTIPLGFFLFGITTQFYKNMIYFTRRILKVIV